MSPSVFTEHCARLSFQSISVGRKTSSSWALSFVSLPNKLLQWLRVQSYSAETPTGSTLISCFNIRPCRSLSQGHFWWLAHCINHPWINHFLWPTSPICDAISMMLPVYSALLGVCSEFCSVFDNDKSFYIISKQEKCTPFSTHQTRDPENTAASTEGLERVHYGYKAISQHVSHPACSVRWKKRERKKTPPPPKKKQKKKKLKTKQNTLQPIKPNVKAHLTPAIGFTLVWNDQTVIVTRSVKSSSHDNCSSSTYYRSSCHSHVLTDLPEGVLFSSIFQWEMGVFLSL